jgi:hypothetical protein
MTYEMYVGDDTPEQQKARAYYLTTSADAVYGWQPQDCSTPQQYVCEMPPGVFACYPPPSPPMPPPLPPSPPSPPVSYICEWPACMMLPSLLARCHGVHIWWAMDQCLLAKLHLG